MKVLFAVSREDISESIIRSYQADYKEIISAKNVYYFNAIIKELQKDKTYDRIVLSEDLEPFSNKNSDMIDKFILDRLENISNEAINMLNEKIPIIVICTDRREKSETMLSRIFSLGVYNALIGKDRVIENVCELINAPRNKKDAKDYYKIEDENIQYKLAGEDVVSEAEIQNIILHYKKLGKNEDMYIQSFNNIAAQYSNEQLKLIVRFLPLNVKAVLEESCPKYQKVMIGSVRNVIEKQQKDAIKTTDIEVSTTNYNTDKSKKKIELIEKELKKSKMTKPVLVPTEINLTNVKKEYEEQPRRIQQQSIEKNQNYDEQAQNRIGNKDINAGEQNDNLKNTQVSSKVKNDIVQPVKRGRGRPPKIKVAEDIEKDQTALETSSTEIVQPIKKGRGRPKKETSEITRDISEIDNLLPGIEKDMTQGSSQQKYEMQNSNILSGLEDSYSNDEQDTVLPGLDDSLQDYKPRKENTSDFEKVYDNVLPGIEQDNINSPQINDDFDTLPGLEDNYSNTENEKKYTNSTNNPTLQNNNEKEYNVKSLRKLESLITSENKIVSFVGTSKNGTSFVVNNLAALLSAKGINTAILDLTKNKNAYYIYTQNDEDLRNKAFNCVQSLRMGNTDGIQVNKNLTVYTTAPNGDDGIEDFESILSTLVKNHSLILMDCDFDTNYGYFDVAQELYLVQTFDILTIQPLTAFLRELADKDVLKQDRLRIIINKALKVKNLTERMIIGGISSYNDPSMSYMKELFNKETVIYTTLPFEDQTYVKYLEGLATCEISLNGYSKGLLDSLSKLENMVYPLITNKPQYGSKPNYNNYNKNSTNSTQFGNGIDSTLDKMRNKF